MSATWDRWTVEDLQEAGTLLVEDGNHGEYRPRPDEFAPIGTAFIRAADMSDGRVLFESAEHINEVALRRIRKGLGKGGDVLFSHKGTVGKLALVPSDAPSFVCSPQTTSWRTLDEERLDRRFLYCFMRSPQFRKQWLAVKGETDMADYVSLTAQRRFEVSVPPPPTQRAIAHLLGALDDKIELNRQMSRTLEAMAQALFKSWFVDFDPVVAKAAGRQPFGMDAETAALFPSRFVDSELGPIPEGWSASVLGEVAEEVRTQADPGGLAPSTPYIGLEHMPRRSIALSEWGYAADVSSGKHAFRRGDILFGKLRPYFHKVGVAPLDGVCSTDIVVLRAKKPEHAALVLGHASSREFVDYNDAASEGTRMPRTNWKRMEKYPVVISCDRSGAEASALFKWFVERIASQIHESRPLASLRDGLLPKLLSGEIRVKDAEREAERSL